MIVLTDATFDEEIGKSEVGPILVDFWATWCGPCRAVAPILEELSAEYKGKVKVGKVDADSNRDVSFKYGITAIPTIILFQDGEVIKKFVGLTSKDQFEAALNELDS